jgi:tetratricopeptide (TPR) repeat protein
MKSPTSAAEQNIFERWKTTANLSNEQIQQGYKSLTALLNSHGVNYRKSIDAKQSEECILKLIDSVKKDDKLQAGLDYSVNVRPFGDDEPHIRLIVEHESLVDIYHAQGRFDEAIQLLKDALAIVQNTNQSLTPDMSNPTHEERCQLELKLAELYFYKKDFKSASKYFRDNRIHYLIGEGHSKQASAYTNGASDWLQQQMVSYFSERKRSSQVIEERNRLGHLFSQKCTHCENQAPFAEPFAACKECKKPVCSENCRQTCWNSHRIL